MNDLQEELSPFEIATLESAGIDLHSTRHLGEGKNRIVYSAYREHVPVRVCVEKKNSSSQTPAAIKNRGRNSSTNEIAILKEMGETGAISLEGEGRKINIIPFPSETDLEKIIASGKPLKSRTDVQYVVGYILTELKELSSRGYLHRDIKPDNILIDHERGNLVARLGDFELAGKKEKIESSPLPTRGTGTYAHPSLLNAWITGEPARATERTELYSFGASVYEMFTGKKPSRRKIVENSKGREVEIAGHKTNVSLFDGKERLARINESDEEKRVKQMSREVPQWAQGFVYRCLSDRGGFQTFTEADRYFNGVIERGYLDDEANKTWKPGVKISSLAASLILGLGVVFGPNSEIAKSYEKDPTSIRNVCLSNPAQYNPSKSIYGLYIDHIVPKMTKPMSGEAAE